MHTDDYEKLGAFYLGRPVDASTGEDRPEPLLYDSKDLTTHAVLLGMTGSGKTGLAIALLEEALIDGIPVIAIDPKGDLGNLLLTFPRLEAADFRPWIDEAAATRAGETPDAFAARQAKLWREGLAAWGQGPERIARLEAAAERVLYTPGSRAGRPLSVLRSFDAPPPAVLEDDEALRERIQASVSGLLGLVGVTADPLQSREHILLSTLVERAWRAGRNLDLPGLIQQVQRPPVERVGVFDVETFFPSQDRMGLAMRLNNLLASPGFAAWLEGEPLDIGHLLRAPDGRPRLSIISIAHLSDAERMFVVTLVLGQLVAWMRTQSGSASLRALLYMDEVFGFFPPSANPPSKPPMLTLLKQARAFGLGCVLATQNPVDLDYKGLSNCGTWLLGRLQTERDKARVIDGLESAAAGAAALGRDALERTLSSLDSRVFLMNNVHEDEPVLLRSRWALSYLAGPLSRAQIQRLCETEPALAPAPPAGMAPAGTGAVSAADSSAAAAVPTTVDSAVEGGERPALPAEVDERFVPPTWAAAGDAGEPVWYRPVLVGRVAAHYVHARAGVDTWMRHVLEAPLPPELEGSPWSEARALPALPELASDPLPGARFATLPGAAERATGWGRFAKELVTHVYRERPLELWSCREPRLVSLPGEEEGAFRGRLADALHAERDLRLEKLRARYAPRLARLRQQIERAGERVDQEQEQYADRRTQTFVSFGATLVGALFGRKLGSVGNVGRAASTMKGASRTARERADVDRAEARLEQVHAELAALEAELEQALAEARAVPAPNEIEIEPQRITARKGDLDVEQLMLVWVPWQRTASGAT